MKDRKPCYGHRSNDYFFPGWNLARLSRFLSKQKTTHHYHFSVCFLRSRLVCADDDLTKNSANSRTALVV